MSTTCAVIVAAGSGVRLGAGVPKALVPLAGEPLVVHAVRALRAAGVDEVVVTVPESHRAEFEAALEPLSAHTVVGGERRQDSVRLGLDALSADDSSVVLVHDAARPLVPADVVRRVVDAVAAGADAVVPAVALADSIRSVDGPCTRVVDRADLRAVQTPQGFPLGLLRRAHAELAASGADVTDDAAAAEASGHDVVVVDGDRMAFKVTEPMDLAMAELVLREGR